MSYNGVSYKQKKGEARASPVSPIVTNVYTLKKEQPEKHLTPIHLVEIRGCYIHNATRE